MIQVFLLVIQLSVCRGVVYRLDGERARAIVIGSSAGKDDESLGRVASPRWPRRLGPDCAAPQQRLLEELQAPGGLDGWILIVLAPRTPPALIAHVRLRFRLEAVHIAFIKRQRAAAWADLCQEIREYRVKRPERYDRAIATWKELCCSDSDLD